MALSQNDLFTIEQPQTAPQGVPRVADLCAIDLSAAETFSAGPPHEAFDLLRTSAPVAWQDERPGGGRKGAELHTGMSQPESPGFWVVTSHTLVNEVSKDPSTYSSYLGGTQMFSVDETLLAGLRLMLLYMDPPEQTRLRKILVPAFSPRTVATMREAITASAAELVGAIGGTVDLVETVTKQLPTRVLAAMLGMPHEDWHLIPEWSDSLIDSEAADLSDEDIMASVLTFQAIHDYGAAIFEDRRRNPTDDIASTLANAVVEGERLTVEEFCMVWMLLIVAGNETTRNATSGAVLALHRHGLWKPLAEQVHVAGSIDQLAVDELTRYVSPVMHFRRTATRDVTLGDQLVRAGDKVVMWYGAANRDPAVFDDPHDLVLDRDPNPHLAFGIGPHFCLGSRLARMQMNILLTELLTRCPDLALAGEPEHVTSTFINGIEKLTVKVGRP